MIDDRELAGLDPYDLMATESARLAAFFGGLGAADWNKPTRCAGWTVRDVLAHLAACEDYNAASLDGTVQKFMVETAAKGATDLATANDLGIHQFDGRSPQQLLDEWQVRITRNREGFRARDGHDVDTSIGAYPARWQAFHLAFELATHADDVGVPVTPAEADGRLAWETRFGRFALHEGKPELTVTGGGGRTHVQGDGIDVDLDDTTFLAAVTARLPDDSDLDPKAATVLAVTP